MNRYIHARVYAGTDDDLIKWMNSLPPGDRSRVIREALRAGIGLMPPPQSDMALLAEIVRQAVAEALGGIQLAAAKQGVDFDTNEVEEAFGSQLDALLSGFK